MSATWIDFPISVGWWWVWDDILKLEPVRVYVEKIDKEQNGHNYFKARGFERHYHANGDVSYSRDEVWTCCAHDGSPPHDPFDHAKEWFVDEGHRVVR
jgi:hypothetical protein